MKLALAEMAKTENMTTSKSPKGMLLGFDLHSWEIGLIISLGLAAIAAVAIAATTFSVVRLTKYENKMLKLDVAQANERAATATARSDEAKLELAKFRQPRALTPEQKAEMIAKLSPY